MSALGLEDLRSFSKLSRFAPITRLMFSFSTWRLVLAIAALIGHMRPPWTLHRTYKRRRNIYRRVGSVIIHHRGFPARNDVAPASRSGATRVPDRGRGATLTFLTNGGGNGSRARTR